MRASFHSLKLLPVAAILFFCCQSSQAQFLKRLKQKVAQTAGDHVINDAGNATDNAIDKAEHPDIHKKNKDNNNDNNSGNSPDNNNDANNNSNATSAAPSIKSYKNYDFVPGDTVIFQSNLVDERVGEIPSQFIVSDGQMDIQEEDGMNVVHIVKGPGATFSPRMKTNNYLPDRFTVEFDYKNETSGANHLDIYFGEGNGIIREVNFFGTTDGIRWTGEAGYPADLAKTIDDNPDQWHHLAIAVNKNAGKAYVDQYRVLNVNNLTGKANNISFVVHGYENSFIKNIRIAAGGIDNYKKVTTDGKIVMHGILFDVDKATLKPESMGSINEIYYLLKKDPSLKFEIDGHTDNTGEAAHNLTLSQQRAEVVKAQLIKMGIDAGRLTSKGFGDTKPISDNDSPEGRANNRRVEFLRK